MAQCCAAMGGDTCRSPLFGHRGDGCLCDDDCYLWDPDCRLVDDDGRLVGGNGGRTKIFQTRW